MKTSSAKGSFHDPIYRLSTNRQRRVCVALLVCSAAPVPYPGSELVIAISGVLAIGFCLADNPEERLRTSAALPVGLALLALASSAWSATPLQTMKGGLQLLIVAVAAVVISRALALGDFLKGAARGFQVLLTLSVLFAIVLPSKGLVSESYEGGALKGIFDHRNLMAFVSVLALITFWAARQHLSRRELVVSMVLAVACIGASQSSSAIVIVFAVAAVWLAVRYASRFSGASRGTVLAVGSSTIAFGTWWALTSLATIAEGLGRDPTLTGRTAIWDAVIDAASVRPWFGWGWDAAWHDGLALTNRIWLNTRFEIYQAHNGFLDFYLQLGLIGAGILCALLLVGMYRAAAAVLSYNGRDRNDWSLLVISCLIVADFSESRLPTLLGWLVTTLAYCYARPSGQVASRKTAGGDV